MSLRPEDIQNRRLRHTPGAPRKSSRIYYNVTPEQAQQGLETAAQLSPVTAGTTKPYDIPTVGEGATEWSDDAKYPIILPGHGLLAAERLQKQIRRERGIAAILAALGIAGLTFASVQGEIHTRLAENVINALQRTADYLNRPQVENLRDFENRARRFHSQR